MAALLLYYKLKTFIMIHATLHNKQMNNGPTVSKQWLRQFSEEGFEQAADYIQVLPSLWRHKERGFMISCSIITRTTRF